MEIKDDTSLFDETGDKISRLEEKVDKILEIESTQIANALGEQVIQFVQSLMKLRNAKENSTKSLQTD